MRCGSWICLKLFLQVVLGQIHEVLSNITISFTDTALIYNFKPGENEKNPEILCIVT